MTCCHGNGDGKFRMAGNFEVARWGPGRPLSRGELVVCILRMGFPTINLDIRRPAPTHPHGVPVVPLHRRFWKHYWARTDLWTSVLQPVLNSRTFRNSLRRSIQFSDSPGPLGYPRALISPILHFLMSYPVHRAVITHGTLIPSPTLCTGYPPPRRLPSHVFSVLIPRVRRRRLSPTNLLHQVSIHLHFLYRVPV